MRLQSKITELLTKTGTLPVTALCTGRVTFFLGCLLSPQYFEKESLAGSETGQAFIDASCYSN